MKNEPANPTHEPASLHTSPAQIAAIIVLYNPKPELMDRLLRSLDGQVQRTIVIDNSPSPSADFPAYFAARKIYYQALGENTGIAKAQNIGIARAIDEQCSHVLLLDQDSALPPRMTERLLEAEARLLGSGTEVGSVGPAFIHENTGRPASAIRHSFLHVRRIPVEITSSEPVEADYIIASGSLIRVEVLHAVGTMREELFIDWVDIEWGLRAQSMGFRNFVVPGANMQHTIGDKATRALGRQINLHDDVRNYYIVRNATYLLRVKTMTWRWRSVTFLKIPQYILFYSVHSPNPRRSMALLWRAFLDGCCGRLGRIA